MNKYSCTAATDGSDYIGLSKDVVFPAGSRRGAARCVDIVIIDTTTVENNETFVLTLTGSSLGTVTFLGGFDAHVSTVTITETNSRLSSYCY